MSTVGDGYGSQYHLRRWVNGNQSSLDANIENAYRTLNLPPIDPIRWVSPIESDGFRELAGMEYSSGTADMTSSTLGVCFGRRAKDLRCGMAGSS